MNLLLMMMPKRSYETSNRSNEMVDTVTLEAKKIDRKMKACLEKAEKQNKYGDDTLVRRTQSLREFHLCFVKIEKELDDSCGLAKGQSVTNLSYRHLAASPNRIHDGLSSATTRDMRRQPRGEDFCRKQ